MDGDEGSASETDNASEDEGWVDPVTRALPFEKTQEGDPVLFEGPSVEDFSFRLPSAGEAGEKRESAGNGYHKSVLENPIPPSGNTRSRQARLLPNPMATSLLDPSVPAVPASRMMMTSGSRTVRHQTPFHLQKTLILDLDETLIHSTSRPLSYAASAGGGLLGLSFGGLFGRGKRKEGHTVEVVMRGRSTTYHVYKRPYVDHFLRKVSCGELQGLTEDCVLVHLGHLYCVCARVCRSRH